MRNDVMVSGRKTVIHMMPEVHGSNLYAGAWACSLPATVTYGRTWTQVWWCKDLGVALCLSAANDDIGIERHRSLIACLA
jgi:hypothetical protein